MPYQHVSITRAGGFVVIVQADFHGFDFTAVLEIACIIAVTADMAAVAVNIGLGMAHLTLNLTDMICVIPHILLLHFFVAILATHRLLQVIASRQVFGRRSMHLFCFVA